MLKKTPQASNTLLLESSSNPRNNLYLITGFNCREQSEVTFFLTPIFFQRYNQWAENLINLYPGPVGWGGANRLLPNSFETIRNIQMKLYRMAASNISWGTSNFDCVEALTSLKHRLCWRETFPEEPQTLTVSKHRTYWSISYAGKQHFLRNLKLWLCRSFDLAQISIVQASNIPWETSNLDCVEELTSLKHQVCRQVTFPE